MVVDARSSFAARGPVRRVPVLVGTAAPEEAPPLFGRRLDSFAQHRALSRAILEAVASTTVMVGIAAALIVLRWWLAAG